MIKIKLIKETALIAKLNRSQESDFKTFCQKISFFEPNTAIVLVRNIQDKMANIDWDQYFDISKLSSAYNKKYDFSGGHLENSLLIYDQNSPTLVELIKLLHGSDKGLDVAYLGSSQFDHNEADALQAACQKLSPYNFAFQKSFI